MGTRSSRLDECSTFGGLVRPLASQFVGDGLHAVVEQVGLGGLAEEPRIAGGEAIRQGIPV